MTNANSFHSAVFVLLAFGAIYFVVLGIYGIKKLIKRMKDKRAGRGQSPSDSAQKEDDR